MKCEMCGNEIVDGVYELDGFYICGDCMAEQTMLMDIEELVFDMEESGFSRSEIRRAFGGDVDDFY